MGREMGRELVTAVISPLSIADGLEKERMKSGALTQQKKM